MKTSGLFPRAFYSSVQHKATEGFTGRFSNVAASGSPGGGEGVVSGPRRPTSKLFWLGRKVRWAPIICSSDAFPSAAAIPGVGAALGGPWAGVGCTASPGTSAPCRATPADSQPPGHASATQGPTQDACRFRALRITVSFFACVSGFVSTTLSLLPQTVHPRMNSALCLTSNQAKQKHLLRFLVMSELSLEMARSGAGDDRTSV